MSRGVGKILLSHVLMMARERNAIVRAEFIVNDRNRMMYITYKFSGFKEYRKDGDFILFQHDPTLIPVISEYVKLQVMD